MGSQPEDIGESTITLAPDGERRFWTRLSAVLLLAVPLFILQVAGVAGAVAAQAARLFRRLEGRMPDVSRGLAADLEHLPWLEGPLAWIDASTTLSIAQLQGWLVEGSRRLLEALMSWGDPA